MGYLHIVDPARFVVNQNRNHTHLQWWACPTRPSRTALKLLGQHDDGIAHYGVWCLLVAYLATRKWRWYLADSEGNPVTIEDFAWEYRIPSEAVSDAVRRFVGVGWCEWVESLPYLANSEASPRHPEGSPEARNVRNDTNERDERNGRNATDGRWVVIAMRLGLGAGGLSLFRQAMAEGVLESAVYSAVKDQSGRPGKLRTPDAWARTVATNLIKERLA